MTFKKIIGQIHLWIGLVVGLNIFIIGFSGAILTWQPELRELFWKQDVAPQSLPYLPVSTLKDIMSEKIPKGRLAIAFYRSPDQAVEITIYAKGTNYKAFLNPYNGEIVHLQNLKFSVINAFVQLHRNLLLQKLGRPVVHWITLIALGMLITGLIIWLPTRIANIRQRLTIKWRASKKRLNYDLHNVLGFYATWICLFSILSGLFWGFEGFANVFRKAVDAEKPVYEIPKSNIESANLSIDKYAIIDQKFYEMRKKFPDKHIQIQILANKQAPLVIQIINPDKTQTDVYYFDKYTGEPVHGNFEHNLFSQRSRYTKLEKLMHDIHFGTIIGLPGRFLVFFSSLIFSSMPITGLIIWLNRKKNKKLAR